MSPLHTMLLRLCCKDFAFFCPCSIFQIDHVAMETDIYLLLLNESHQIATLILNGSWIHQFQYRSREWIGESTSAGLSWCLVPTFIITKLDDVKNLLLYIVLTSDQHSVDRSRDKKL